MSNEMSLEMAATVSYDRLNLEVKCITVSIIPMPSCGVRGQTRSLACFVGERRQKTSFEAR